MNKGSMIFAVAGPVLTAAAAVVLRAAYDQRRQVEDPYDGPYFVLGGYKATIADSDIVDSIALQLEGYNFQNDVEERWLLSVLQEDPDVSFLLDWAAAVIEVLLPNAVLFVRTNQNESLFSPNIWVDIWTVNNQESKKGFSTFYELWKEQSRQVVFSKNFRGFEIMFEPSLPKGS